tara:strand:+ start:3842 stop:4933 length:1092 start_codon:yes stop_codon:yes gene_type:complete
MYLENLIIKIKLWIFVLLSMVLAVSGCGLLNHIKGTDSSGEDSLEYESIEDKIPPLEIPPDLTGPSTDGRYIVPDLTKPESKTYSAYNKERKDGKQTTILPENFDKSFIKMERSGTQRWLVVRNDPEVVWFVIKEFWKGMGFGIEIEVPEAGVIETDWAENIAITPQNAALRTISTIERDKFRTRLERGEQGFTEIYISHRGMERPTDPGLEAEMLARLIEYFGINKDKARSIVMDSKTKERAHLDPENNSVLIMEGAFDRTWRRVGLALDRIGFTVEDRDRSAGLYFVRYVDPENKINEEPELLDKFLPWNDQEDTNQPTEYRILVIGTETGSEVKVVNRKGKLSESDISKRILNLLYVQLK